MTAETTTRFQTSLARALDPWNLRLDDCASDLMAAHYTAMVEANRRMNLTRITTPSEAAVKHYADSLAMVAYLRQAGLHPSSILDIGTGAGFPALPLAVALPDVTVVAMESTRKKASFLADVVADLGIANLTVRPVRAEQVAIDRRFDIVTARAVCVLGVFLNIADRWLDPHGRAVAYKTARLDEPETAEAQRVAQARKLTHDPRYEYRLTCRDESIDRALVIYRNSQTP